MQLNHLSLGVPDTADARRFYEDFFGFRFFSEQDDGKMVFLKDSSDFLLALYRTEPGEKVNFPSWFHYGFRLKTREQVREVYEKLLKASIGFARDYRDTDEWAFFYCLAPGPYQLEVSWDK